jgi:hypothetical protein
MGSFPDTGSRSKCAVDARPGDAEKARHLAGGYALIVELLHLRVIDADRAPPILPSALCLVSFLPLTLRAKIASKAATTPRIASVSLPVDRVIVSPAEEKPKPPFARRR